MLEIGIETNFVEEIRKGNKHIEGRLGKPKFLKLKAGDTLSVREDLWYEGKIIDSFPHSLIVNVTQILYFESFKEMFDSIDFQEAIPTAKTVEEAIEAYKKYYTDADEIKYGVLSISFELIT